jgi:hypothetical protein
LCTGKRNNPVADSVDWRDVKYKEIFEEEMRGLVKRRASDPSCTIEDIEGMLGHLYIMDGADWLAGAVYRM